MLFKFGTIVFSFSYLLTRESNVLLRSDKRGHIFRWFEILMDFPCQTTCTIALLAALITVSFTLILLQFSSLKKYLITA